MRQLPTLPATPRGEVSSTANEDEPAHRVRRRNIKSGMDRTGTTTILKKITWPHEVVYTSVGKSASYQDMTVLQFFNGYLLVMDSKEVDIRRQMASHLKALMSDAQLYGWKCTRAFHVVFCNQLEQGRCTWFDEEAKMQFRRTLVWHPAHSSNACTNATRTSPKSRQRHSQASYNASVKPGTKACRAFNQGKCDNQASHGKQHYICAYFLGAVTRAYPHTEEDCNRKQGATKNE